MNPSEEGGEYGRYFVDPDVGEGLLNGLVL